MDATRLKAVLAAQGKALSQHKELLDTLMAATQAQQNAPKWIENIPGRRVPYWAPVNLTIPASSTAAVETTYTVAVDGPFVVTGIAAYYRKTGGAYQGHWGAVSSADARIVTSSQQHGHGFLLDHPSLIDGEIEIQDNGSDRNWQARAFASAMLHPQMGGVYVFPISNMLGRTSTLTVRFTPRTSQPNAGVLQFIFCGYKIVQGNDFQP